MAQSPLNAVNSDQAQAYFSNWDSLSTLLTQGKSFSGRERHCAFLNTGGQGFANVSGAAGLDLIDDGRGLALSDWDGDGDLDLWMTHRNGPRIRFLRNDAASKHNAFTLRLEGATTNRDAIGAKVTLTTSSGRLLTRSVRAGDSFLSQSTKALPFGLLDGETITSATVAWPGVEALEPITIPSGAHRYFLKEGSGAAIAQDRPLPTTPLTPSIPQAAASPDETRLVLMHRAETPAFKYVRFDGTLANFTPTIGKPTLINIWASWCGPCLKELAEFTNDYEALAAKDLHIFALSTDAVSEDGSKPDISAAKAFAAKGKHPFELGLIDATTVQALTLVHHRTVAVQQPFSLPSSFLLDSDGKIAVLYKGPVTTEQLLKDIAILDADAKTLEKAAFPFPGQNGVELFSLTALAFAQAYQNGGYHDDARQAIGNQPTSAKEYYFLGTLEQSQSNWGAAAAAYQRAFEMNPELLAVHVPLGVALWQANKKEEAKAHFDEAEQIPSLWTDLGRAYLQIDQPVQALRVFQKAGDRAPDDWQKQSYIANAHIAAGNEREGIMLYEALLRKHPDAHEVSNRLALALATNSTVRNPTRALILANQLGELSDFQDPRVLHTLAVAHASNGDYKQALLTAEKARRIARAIGLTSLANELTERLRDYRENSP